MLIRYFLICITTALFSCSSSENKSPDKENKALSEKKAKDLIMGEMNTPEGKVGGTFTEVKEINIQSIEENMGIYTIKFTWSGTITGPSTPPLPGEDMKNREHQITNEKGELKVQQKDGKWQVLN